MGEAIASGSDTTEPNIIVQDIGYCSFFVRALYDYVSHDSNILSFRAGNVIEVLSQLENGWWDGILYENVRGWIPSNYVELISDEEAASILHSTSLPRTQISSTPTSGVSCEGLSPEFACQKVLELVKFTSFQGPEVPVVARNQALIDQFLRTAKLIVHDVRQFLTSSGVSNVIRSNLDVLQRNEKMSLMRMDLLAKESTSLLSLLVLQIRELTKKLHWCIVYSQKQLYFWNEYQSNVIVMHGSARRLIEMVYAFDEEYKKSPPILKALLRNAWSTDTDCMASLQRSVHPEAYNEDFHKSSSPQVGLSPEVNALLTFDVMPSSSKQRLSQGQKGLDSEIRSSFLIFHNQLNYLYEILQTPTETPLFVSTWLTPLRDLLEHVGSMLFLLHDIDLSTPLIRLQRTSNSHNASEEAWSLAHQCFQHYVSTKKLFLKSAKNLLIAAQTALNTRSWSLIDASHELTSKVRDLEMDADQVIQAMHTCFIHIRSMSTSQKGNRSPKLDSASKFMLSLNIPSPLSLKAVPEILQDGCSHIPMAADESVQKARESPVQVSSLPSTKVNELNLVKQDLKNNLVLSEDGSIKGGTFSGLVNELIKPSNHNSKYVLAFLLTYRTFTTTETLLSSLIQRYRSRNINSDYGTNMHFDVTYQRTLQSRILTILSMWLDDHFMGEDRSSLDMLTKFVQTDLPSELWANERQLLLRLIGLRAHGLDKPTQMPPCIGLAPVPILPINPKTTSLMDMDPLEVARQLTLLESKLFSKIKPFECIDKNYTEKLSIAKREGMQNTIDFHNKVSDPLLLT